MLNSCQTTDPQFTFSTTEYVTVSTFNENGKGQEQQVIALPTSKPDVHFVSLQDVKKDPSILVGYSDEIAQGFFGKAHVTRKDLHSKTDQYYYGACAIDVFLYDESEGEATFIVEHVSIRSLTNAQMSEEDHKKCLRKALS